MPVKVDIDGVGLVELDDSFMDLSDEERQSVINEIAELRKPPEITRSADSIRDRDDVIVDYANSSVAGAPTALLGAKLGALTTPFFPPLGATIGGGIGYLGGDALLSDITGKVINRENYDKAGEAVRGGVLSLGDDFQQGNVSAGASIIDNSLVPYETYDSSSTGVMPVPMP